EEIAALTNLKRLEITGNKLVEIPEIILQLSNLIELFLTHNQIAIAQSSLSSSPASSPRKNPKTPNSKAR
ncbi:MAG: hypothetical protein SVV88_06635, partial [Pseudomonadota bacterium]|nr:hypothetical protein [Pseudomonadota bacterium]